MRAYTIALSTLRTVEAAPPSIRLERINVVAKPAIFALYTARRTKSRSQRYNIAQFYNGAKAYIGLSLHSALVYFKDFSHAWQQWVGMASLGNPIYMEAMENGTEHTLKVDCGGCDGT